MKKIRLLSCILCFILMFFCCSCGWFSPQKYVCEIDDVKSIQIVRLEGIVEGTYQYEYTVLSEVSDIETFVKTLNDLKHSVNWGDPFPLAQRFGHNVIRIEYLNGDFDLIHSDAQCFNRSGENRTGYFKFDDEQFNTLISDYIVE